MTTQERLLSYIDRIERESLPEYSRSEWKARRSHAAGVYVKLFPQYEKAAERLTRSRPGSIGERKARAKQRALHRELVRLKKEINMSYDAFRDRPKDNSPLVSFMPGEPPDSPGRKPRKKSEPICTTVIN